MLIQKKYYLCSVIFRKSNNIRICIQSFLESRIIFVFSHFWKAEQYLYLYSIIFVEPNNIRIRIWSFFGIRIIFVFGHQNTIRSPLALKTHFFLGLTIFHKPSHTMGLWKILTAFSGIRPSLKHDE